MEAEEEDRGTKSKRGGKNGGYRGEEGRRRRMELRPRLSAHLVGASVRQLGLPNKFLVLSFPFFMMIFGKVLI